MKAKWTIELAGGRKIEAEIISKGSAKVTEMKLLKMYPKAKAVTYKIA
jgi:hypothetical protein